MNGKNSLTFAALVMLALGVVTVNAGEPGEYKLEGKGYFYYLHDASNNEGQSNSFDLARLYVGARYFLSENFTMRYLTDIAHQGDDKDGKFEVFSKYAYLDWKVWDNLHLLMGLQGTNNWKQPETAWDYRSIQYSPMESFGKHWGDWAKEYKTYLHDWAKADPTKEGAASNFAAASASKMGSSADLGIGIKMKPMKDSYLDIMIRNGGGYKEAENDMFKNFQVLAGHYFLDKTAHISAFIELEPWKGVDDAGKSKGYINLQWDVMASYTVENLFTLGVDANSKVFKGIEDITATCFSVFGNVSVIPKKLKVLGRFDMYDTGFNDVQIKSSDDKWESNANLIIVGVDYKAHKEVSIIPNIQIVTYEDSKKYNKNSVYLHVYFKL